MFPCDPLRCYLRAQTLIPAAEPTIHSSLTSCRMSDLLEDFFRYSKWYALIQLSSAILSSLIVYNAGSHHPIRIMAWLAKCKCCARIFDSCL